MLADRCLVLLVAWLSVGCAPAQDAAQSALQAIRSALPQAVTGWRFRHPAAPGGERPDLDDREWPLVNPEHQWSSDNTAAWYRKRVVVPRGDLDLSGAPLELMVQVDDDGELYVNGELKRKFHWDEGRVVLTETARPGEEFLVAVRVINQGGPGRLRGATLSCPRLEPVRPAATAAAAELQMALNLARAPGAGSPTLMTAVDAASRRYDLAALARGDEATFTASALAAREQLAPLAAVARQYTLHLVGHAHIDMNWLWLWPETVEVCRATWTQACRFLDEFPEFRFSQSQPAVYRAIQQEQPQLFGDMSRAIGAGRWEVTGTWVECDLNMPSGESLVRQCLLARNYYRKAFGRVPDIGWSPDTFGHAWTVPQILAGCGLKHYYFMRAGKGLPLFRWEGPDGSRLLAYTTDSYNEHVGPHLQLMPLNLQKQAGVRDAMVVYGVGDHGGGPTRQDIETALRLRQSPVFPNVKFSTSRDFFEAALKQRTDLPVVRDELNPIFEGCYTTHGDIKRENRELEYALPAAETLAVMAGGGYPAADFEAAWRNTCFNQFHDILCGSAIAGSYAHSAGLYREAMGAAQQAVDAAVERLLAQVDTRGSGEAFAVFNTLGWPRTDYVEASLRTKAEVSGIEVRGPDGKPVPAQVVERRAEGEGWATTFGFVARDVPPVGWAVYRAQPSTQEPARSEAATTISNGRYELTVDPKTGAVSRLLDRQLNRNLVPPGKALDVLQAHLEDPNGMSAWIIGRVRQVIDLNQVSRVAVTERGPARTTVEVIHTFRQSSFRQRIHLYEGLDRIDFDLTADWREVGNDRDGGVMMKVAFPLALDNPAATFEIPFGAIERSPNGAEVPAQKWIDVTAQDIRPTGKEGVQPRALDLTSVFNNDGLASAAKPGDGDFDRGGWSYPAEILAGKAGDIVTLAGAAFRLPSAADGDRNNIACAGQVIPIDATGPTLTFFGAASNGGKSGALTLTYDDGTSTTAPLNFSDWCFDPAAGEVTVLSKEFRRNASGTTTPAVHVRARKVSTDPERHLRSVTLPQEPDLHVFGIAVGPKTLRVPTYGVSLLNNCKYGHDVSGSQMRLTLLRCPSNPDPRPDYGIHQLIYSLVPHAGDWRQGETVRRAYELNTPLIVRPTSAHAGTRPRAWSFLSLGPGNLVLSVVKRAEDGDGVIVRLYEATGERCRGELAFAAPVARAEQTTLVEERAEKAPPSVSGRRVTLPVGPHEIKTVRVALSAR
jgi:alpha-mannosidase